MSGRAPLAPEPGLLRDGSAIEIRPTTSQDVVLLTEFHAALSDESRFLRFFCAGVSFDAAVRALLAPGVAGFVALAGRTPVGHACLAPTGPTSGELAFAVADAWQHRGVATVLLERLVQEAGRRGMTSLHTEMPAANRPMLAVFRDAGLPLSVTAADGTLTVELAAGTTPDVVHRFEHRHRLAAVAGLQHVLRPSAVAIVGASDRRGSVGGELLRNVRDGGFRGAIHAVHRGGGRVAGIQAVPTPADLPHGVDLALIAVPADHVLDAAQACIDRGIRALVVLSAGFAETGAAGRRRQRQLLDRCRAAGVRLVGPNCLGVVNTDPAVRLNATFAPHRVPHGGIALASQSGAVGIMAMDAARRRGIGLSSFVSLGNRADVSSNDLLRYWAEDDRTRVIALYLESFGNPRAFAVAARDVAGDKPIVAVKGGRSTSGLRAAHSHTGALIEGDDTLTDVLLRDAGITRVDTVGELLDTAAVLDRAGVPRGPRVAVLTNAGGAGIACADAAEGASLQLTRLRPLTRRRLRALRPQAAVGNPVDLLADVAPEDFVTALREVAADPTIDAVIAIHIPPLAGREDDTMARVGAIAGGLTVPMVAVALAQPPVSGLADRVAVLATPEDAARALGRVARHAAAKARPTDPPTPPGRVDRLAGATVIAEGLQRGDRWLAPDLTMRLAAAYRIRAAPAFVMRSAADVADAVARLGGPVAIKAWGPGLVHKTERGAVRLGLATPQDAQHAADELVSGLGAGGVGVTGVLVQKMITGGVELLVGAVSHPTFGPVVLCGAGGVTAELWGDVQTRLAPVGRRTAREMVRSLRCAPLLLGWRGAPRLRIAAAEDAVRRMAALIADRPEIAEIECNPLMVTREGAVAVDLRVRLLSPAER